MHFSRLILVSILASGLAACSAKPKGPLKAGFQSDGSYVTSSQEQNMSCQDVTNLTVVGAGQLGGLQSQANVSTGVGIALAVASIAVSGGTALAYTDFGAKARAERNKQRNRLDEYNKILAAKGCDPVDIEAEIARAKAETATKKDG